jgi:hypothetical protein
LNTIEDALNTINHQKLLGLAAYALSPAFRSVANSGVAMALGTIPPVATQATASLLSFATPALSLFARLTGPIAIAVGAFEGLNYVIKDGSDLLDKYSGEVRSFFGSDVSDNLAKLTKLQPDGDITQVQIQYATELGARLTEAKKTISDFWTVEIDVTDAALRLQAGWVNVVETIAQGVGYLNSAGSAIDSIESVAQTIGNLPFWKYLSDMGGLPGLGSLPGALRPSPTGILPVGTPDTSDADALAAARKRLAAGMGGGGDTFPYARYSQAIRDLANPPAPDNTNPNSTDAYERSIQSIQDQISAMQLEADGASKTSQAVEEMKIAHEANSAAMRAGIPITDQMREQWKAYGDQIADLTIKVNQAKVAQQEAFQGATLFMSPSQLAAANAAHQIDPTNWQAHLNDIGPQMAAMNSYLTQGRDLADSFADSFGQAMLQGKTAAQALNTALNSLASSLISMISKQLVNQALGGLLGMLVPGGSGGGVPGAPLNIIPGVPGGGSMGAMALPNIIAPNAPLSGGYMHPAYYENAQARMAAAAASAGGGSQVVNNINIQNASGQPVTQTSQPNSTGGTDYSIMIGAAVTQQMAKGTFDKTMSARFGVVPVTQRR